MNHQHQFILIEQLTRKPKYTKRINAADSEPYELTGPTWRDEYGARVGCPLCGEIRVIWADGEVIIENTGHEEKV